MPAGLDVGVSIGLRDMHYALLTSDTSSAVVYSAPVPIIGANMADLKPNPSIESLFGDDGPMETASTLGKIELDISALQITVDVQAALLGHTVDATTGIMLSKAGDTPPWVAVGFRSLKTNGSYKWVWLLKGKFAELDTKYETKSDKLAFQTPSIKGQFVKRVFDDAWKATVDDDYSAGALTATASWFTKVPGQV